MLWYVRLTRYDSGMPPKELDAQKVCSTGPFLAFVSLSSQWQWEVHPLGAGHSIRNLKYGKYLSVKSIAKEALVVSSDFPVAWHVKEVHVPEENTAFYE